MRALMLPLRRPVATGAVYLALLLFGTATLFDLPLSLSPDLDYPALSVQLSWPFASPEQMEALVTSRVEAEAELLPEAHEVSSVSGEGWARIDIALERGSPVDRAEVFLRERLAALRDDLPTAVDPPIIDRYVPEEMRRGDFFVLQVEGARTDQALRELVDDQITPRLLGVPGVSDLEVYGGRDPETRIDLALDPIERGDVEVGSVLSAFDRVGTDDGLGALAHGGWSLPVVLDRPPAAAATVGEVIVGGSRELPRRVRSVGSAVDGWEEPQRLSRIDGNPAITVVLEREAGSNVLEVVRSVRRTLEEIRASLPPDVDVAVLHDQSESISRELDSLSRRSLVSILAIFAVLLVLERRWRSPLVVLLTVLFSALATFVCFRVVGIGINLVTLSGLALAFGMSVDNSIVILENVGLRHRGPGPTAGPAGAWTRLRTLAATREVLFPLVAGTATTTVVLTPFLYLSGDLRDYYLPFILSVSLSLLASLVVAVSLTPPLARWALSEPDGPATGPDHRKQAARTFRSRANGGYGRLLAPMLRRPGTTALVALLAFGGSLFVFDRFVSRGSIFPSETDTSLNVGMRFPPGSDLHDVDAMITRFERFILEHPLRAAGHITKVEALVLANRGMLRVRFSPRSAETAVPQTIKEELTVRAAAVSGANVSITGFGPGFSGSSGTTTPSYQLNLRGPDYLELGRLADDLGRRLGNHPRVREIDTNASNFMLDDAIAMAVVPDREAIARHGLSVRDLVAAIQPAIAGEFFSGRRAGLSGDVNTRVRLAGGEAQSPEALLNTRLLTPRGTAVRLGALARLEERPVPAEIHRRHQQYERAVSFDFRGPRPIADRYVRSFIEGTTLPPGYILEEGLGLLLSRREEQAIGLALGFALVLIYLVSAALFESLILPFVAILSVPLGFIGIAFTFWIADLPFDRTAYVGLILLAGVAVNNALLWVHRAGQILRRTGDVVGAALRASIERWIPILITTLTSVAGLLPLAIGADPGTSGNWRSLALSTTAGLGASTIVTLSVVPALFILFERKRTRPARSAGN
ncbi:MAG: efflux RND transporter permease subunit [Candidatus Eisenbacteria bacterium]|nr:efflux RND transporter permease subunit [Candidatus Eisenbacteria bacterium]